MSKPTLSKKIFGDCKIMDVTPVSNIYNVYNCMLYIRLAEEYLIVGATFCSEKGSEKMWVRNLKKQVVQMNDLLIYVVKMIT